ncbi:UDP-N-acetylglucosamine 1-carboxyvinyltransferase [Patescibacteria group bacterium]|nr:UDP-N-acetylglucosamine 1-carboxyvinyltransferase [Patescibacteria group bacterium]
MEQFVITGGKALSGEVQLRGAKNAATKMMLATLLTDEQCVLENFPDLGDTAITAELCKQIGSNIVKHDKHTVAIQTAQVLNPRVKPLSRKNRIPILAIGPLLHRAGVAEVPVVGGDRIGPRPVNFHIDALSQMGAEIVVTDTSFIATSPNGMFGKDITLPYPSVGATENIMLAGVLAQGRTIIRNGAKEPEVLDLIKMLQKMGAIIGIEAHRTIVIDGVRRLRGVTHTILPDRNEAVSFAAMAYATGGNIFVRGAVQDHLLAFLNMARRAGCDYEVRENGIRFFADAAQKFNPVAIETDTHPGFMTDWQQPFAVLLLNARGTSTIHETVYEDRFGYAHDLKKMGADVRVTADCLGNAPCRFRGNRYNHSCAIQGPVLLQGTEMEIQDIRAGMAHLIAALSAEGVSRISGIEHLDRGYEDIDSKLQALGAGIRRVPV